MDIIMGLINLFAVPFVGVALYYHRNNWKLAPNIDLFSRYIIFVVCNLPLDTLILYIVGFDIEVWGKPYTIIALFTVCLFPYIVQIAKAYVSIRLEVNKKSK